MNNALHRKPHQSFPDKIKNCAVLFVNLSAAMLLALFTVRIMEFTYISRTNNLPLDFWNVVGHAFVFDILSFLEILPFLFIPFFMIYFVTGTIKFSYLAYGAAGSVVIILYASLVKYFATAGVPLAADLFGYFMEDIEINPRSSAAGADLSFFLFFF